MFPQLNLDATKEHGAKSHGPNSRSWKYKNGTKVESKNGMASSNTPGFHHLTPTSPSIASSTSSSSSSSFSPMAFLKRRTSQDEMKSISKVTLSTTTGKSPATTFPFSPPPPLLPPVSTSPSPSITYPPPTQHAPSSSTQAGPSLSITKMPGNTSGLLLSGHPSMREQDPHFREGPRSKREHSFVVEAEVASRPMEHANATSVVMETATAGVKWGASCSSSPRRIRALFERASPKKAPGTAGSGSMIA